jgi:hypothetical protein
LIKGNPGMPARNNVTKFISYLALVICTLRKFRKSVIITL